MVKTFKYFSLLLLLCAFTFPAKNVSLKYTFRKGDAYSLVQTSKQTIKQNIQGMGELVTEVNMDGTMDLKILEKTSTGARIEATYKKLKLTTKSSAVSMNLDSEGPQDDMQNKLAKSMMNKPFTFTMNHQGIIEKVENAENIYSGLDSIGLEASQVTAARQSLELTVNEKTLKSSLEGGLVNYPGNKIKVGGTWNSAATLTLSFPLEVQNTWTLKNLEGKQARLESDGMISSKDRDKVNTLPNGLKTKADLSGRQAVVGKVDLQTGWPTEVKVLAEIKGTMTFFAGGMIPQDMAVPMEILIESTHRIIKK